jgi:DNA-binding NarL/FixJ family response regulator
MNQSTTYAFLSNRQREILTLLATGNTDQEIADALNLSMHTVKTHLKIIYKKWEVRNRLEAVNIFNQHFMSAPHDHQ